MNDNYWGVKNNTSLPELNAESLVRNLKERYHKAYLNKSHEAEGDGGSGIYTWTGTVLLAVNPYQRLNVYGDTQVDHHFAKSITQADPHPFGIASHAYGTLNKTKSAQSIVVSGESGAGKTETAKFVMRFLSQIGRSSAGDSLSEFLESTNPILEAFGNAKTCRNENSSRFGKVMKLFYAASGAGVHHKLVSAAVETYLLARSRVTHTPANERNYHVFYLLANGGIEGSFPELKAVTRPAVFFNYLSGSNMQSGYMSDSAFLKDMLHAFTSLGIDKADQAALFELVFALLWMGNIALENEDDKCTVPEASMEAVQIAAKLLAVSPAILVQVLTQQKLSIGSNNKSSSSSVWTATNSVKAKTVRDAVVKRIYAKLFDHIVLLLNEKLSVHMASGSPTSSPQDLSDRFISILDIFGFENLPSNGLEQLCINYANERLQNFFLRNVVISEAEEYSRECIPYPGVNPPDNGPVIRAIAGRGGIFDLLKKTTVDSMVRPLEGRDYDGEFYNTLAETSKGIGSLVKIPTTSRRVLAPTFTVCHYAEEVVYTVESFVESNKDSDARVDFILSHFENPLLRECLSDLAPAVIAAGASSSQRQCIATSFSSQVDHLLTDHLEKTRLHCIRCLKPNDAKKPNAFDAERVGGQLRVSGMYEVLTLMAHAFPIRIAYLDLFYRYKPLLSEKILVELARQSGSTKNVNGASARLFVQETVSLLSDQPDLLADGGQTNSTLIVGTDYQFGTSKVFFRLGKVEPLERLLAACDKDKSFAKHVADLIGKRIMAKRKSRQLKFMRTSFKLLVILRRRRAYWKWFHAYFIRLAFIVKVCRQVFVPRIKLRRLQKSRAATLIARAYRAYVDRKKFAAMCLIKGQMKSFQVRQVLSGKSKLKFEMQLGTELLQGVLQTLREQRNLAKKIATKLELDRLARLEALRLEAEHQARLVVKLREEREEAERQAKIEQERIAVENQQMLLQANVEISALKQTCFEASEQHAASLVQSEATHKGQMEVLQKELEAQVGEMEEQRAKFEVEVNKLKLEHEGDVTQFELRLSEANELIEVQIAALETELAEKLEEIDKLQTSFQVETSKTLQQAEQLAEATLAIESLKTQLAGEIEMGEYRAKKLGEEMESLLTNHKVRIEEMEGTIGELNREIARLESAQLSDAEKFEKLKLGFETEFANAKEEFAQNMYISESRIEQLLSEANVAREAAALSAEEQTETLAQLRASHSDDLNVAHLKMVHAEESLKSQLAELAKGFADELEQVRVAHREELAAMRLTEHTNSAAEKNLVSSQLQHEMESLKSENELTVLSVKKEFEAKISQIELSYKNIEYEQNRQISQENSKNLHLQESLSLLKLELRTEKENYQRALSQQAAEFGSKETLFTALLAASRAETTAVTDQLESVVQEKAKLAQVASSALMQGEKLKKDSEDLVKRERAEMERKLSAETARIKKDFEIFNKRALEVKMQEVEQVRLETKRNFADAEQMRNDALKMIQELQAVDSTTLAVVKRVKPTVLSQDTEEVVQQAIHDYHSASDEYERSYVIERRRDTARKEKVVQTAQLKALEAKLQRTIVAVPRRSSLGGAKIPKLAQPPLSPPRALSPRN